MVKITNKTFGSIRFLSTFCYLFGEQASRQPSIMQKFEEWLFKLQGSQKMSNAVDLYYIPVSPPCRNVLLVARAVGVNLNLKTVNIMEGEHMTPEFLKMNPEHTIPTMNDNGLIIWESRPIMTYLIDMYAKDAAIQDLYPKDVRKRVLVDQRLYFDACSLYKNLVEYFGPVIRGISTSTDEIQRMKFEESLSVLNHLLKNKNWVAGDDMTVADISIMVTIDTAEAVGIDIGKQSNVENWLHRCRKEMDKYGYDEIEKVGANMFGQAFRSRLSP